MTTKSQKAKVKVADVGVTRIKVEQNPIASLVKEKQKEILDAWMDTQLSSITLREDLISKDDLRKQSTQVLDALVKAISSGNLEDISTPEYEPVSKMLADISHRRAVQGFTPSETTTYIFSLKDPIIAFLQAEYRQQPELLNSEVIVISKLLDKLGLLTFETFAKGREEVIQRQQKELLELSTPVIRVWDGVLAVPLIGTLDSNRTLVVMQNLLETIAETGYFVAILDISGVPIMDTLVVQHILKTVTAARLMGAECIISGIRPEIAQTMVQLGVDMAGVKTKATLAGALEMAFEMRNLTVGVIGKLQNEA